MLGRILRRPSLHQSAWWMLIYAAGVTPFTVAAGFFWKHSLGEAALPPAVFFMHQWLGVSLALLFAGLAVWRWNIHSLHKTPGVSYLAVAVSAVLALAYQGTLGGQMVFG